jgi:hypothetical protein
MVQPYATRCSCIAILWVRLVSFAAITLCVASRPVFFVVSIHFVIDSVRKLMDTPSLCGVINAMRCGSSLRAYSYERNLPVSLCACLSMWLNFGYLLRVRKRNLCGRWSLTRERDREWQKKAVFCVSAWRLPFFAITHRKILCDHIYCVGLYFRNVEHEELYAPSCYSSAYVVHSHRVRK